MRTIGPWYILFQFPNVLGSETFVNVCWRRLDVSCMKSRLWAKLNWERCGEDYIWRLPGRVGTSKWCMASTDSVPYGRLRTLWKIPSESVRTSWIIGERQKWCTVGIISGKSSKNRSLGAPGQIYCPDNHLSFRRELLAGVPARTRSQVPGPLANCPAAFLSYFHCGFVMKYSWQIQRSQWAIQVGWVGQFTSKYAT